LTTTTTDAAITRDLHLPASPERVWAALTEPAEISAWFGHVEEFRLEPGSVGWFDFGGDGRVQFRLEAIEVGRYIAWRWADALNTELSDPGSTLVEWWVEPASGHAPHSGFANPASGRRPVSRATHRAGSKSSATCAITSRSSRGSTRSAEPSSSRRIANGCGGR
jgi:uncharacterized protein YndB with AHSA1/START domain